MGHIWTGANPASSRVVAGIKQRVEHRNDRDMEAYSIEKSLRANVVLILLQFHTLPITFDQNHDVAGT